MEGSQMRNLTARVKNSFARHSHNSSHRGAKQAGLAARAKRRQRALGLESLEGRALLSLTPEFLLDINTTNLPSNPSGLVAVGSTTYFTADDAVNGRELWKSNGTAAGTVLVKDITPGSAGSNLASFTNVNGTLFFIVNDSATGTELWKSDGT